MADSVRVAAIDCGTNSIRLLITDVADGDKEDQLREMRIVRLGEAVDTSGRLADQAIARTLAACQEYAAAIEALGADVVSFGATSAVRDVENAQVFGDQIEAILGVRPQVLTGEQEAQASFEGATRELSGPQTAVLDIGGGSTEIVVGDEAGPSWSTSLDIGSVRMTERFLHHDPPGVGEVGDCSDFLDGLIRPAVSSLAPIENLIGVAGTITTVAAHSLALPTYDSDNIHHARLNIDDLRQACLSLIAMSVADRRNLPYMAPGRADVIGAGALILDRLLEHLPTKTNELSVSEHDILDGIAWAAARSVTGS